MSIVTFDQAKRLFQIGFQEMTFGAYWRDSKAFKLFEYDSNWNKTADANGCYSAPEVHDALQWFRDEKGIFCTVDMEYYDGIHYFGKFMDIGLKDGGETEEFNNFPEAESALLDALLNYLEGEL